MKIEILQDSYGKTGDKQVGDFESTVQSVNSANPTSTIIPVIITEVILNASTFIFNFEFTLI